MAGKQTKIDVNGRTLGVSNLEKVLYPGGHFTKAHVIDYYIRIAEYLLPHLKNRPVTLKRFPNGVFGEFFYEKDAPAFTPEWIETFAVPRRERKGEDIQYILINDLPTLVWLANLANLEIHPFLHKVPKIDQPTSIVFDCDPGEGTDILTCARVAFRLRAILGKLDLECWAKVSGSKGLQVYVPLNTATTYEVTQQLAKSIARLLAQQEPKLIVAEMSKALRRRKVFIDWSQNSDFKTTVGVYSLRAKSHKPLVSMPVDWKELESASKANDPTGLYFDPESAIARVEERGDLFTALLTTRQHLPKDFESPARSARSRSKTRQSAGAGLRRSAQGGRRRFFVRQGVSSFKIALELDDLLKLWSVKQSSLMTEGEHSATLLKDRAVTDSDFAKAGAARGTKAPWDLGTYETIEGSFQSGELQIHFQGTKLKGQ